MHCPGDSHAREGETEETSLNVAGRLGQLVKHSPGKHDALRKISRSHIKRAGDGDTHLKSQL